MLVGLATLSEAKRQAHKPTSSESCSILKSRTAGRITKPDPHTPPNLPQLTLSHTGRPVNWKLTFCLDGTSSLCYSDINLRACDLARFSGLFRAFSGLYKVTS